MSLFVLLQQLTDVNNINFIFGEFKYILFFYSTAIIKKLCHFTLLYVKNKDIKLIVKTRIEILFSYSSSFWANKS